LEIAMPIHTHSSRKNFILAASFVALTVLTAVVMPRSAHAYDEKSTSALNVDAQGVALKGYDTVSYFSSGGPVQGSASFSAKYGGATYWFANANNQDTFNANPEKYTPAFGGFCAMGMALEQKLDVDPQLWRIVDSKLI
jgi:YHS domain-containing protein